MDGISVLSQRELAALRSIEELSFGADYWEEETIKLFRGLGLVLLDGKQIRLTAAGKQTLKQPIARGAARGRREGDGSERSDLGLARMARLPCSHGRPLACRRP